MVWRRIFKRRKVHCAGCAHLFFVGGKTHPMCVATASFMSGPIRKRVDVVGIIRAETRNRKNECPYRSSVSVRAWEMKRWLLWRLNDGIEGKRTTEKGIEEYPVSEENRVSIGSKPKTIEHYAVEENFRYSEGSEFEASEGEEGESGYDPERGETLHDVGGIGSDDEFDAPDTDGGEDVQDS